jgi:hypothetical protein
VVPGGTDEPPTPDESILSRRFIDRTTQWSGLGELRLETEGSAGIRSHGVLRVGRARTRGDLEIEGDGPIRFGRLSAGGRFFFQAGPEGSGAGRTLTLRSSWLAPRLPGSWEARLGATGERSWAGADSLSRIFDYTRIRPSLQLRRPLGWTGEVALRAGIGVKSAPDSGSGEYRERWLEGEWTTFSFRGLQAGLRVRSEGRSYSPEVTVLPSYEEFAAEGEMELPVFRRLRLRLAPSLRRVAYASDDSLVFRDNDTGELLVRLEAPLGGGGGGEDGDARGRDESVETTAEGVGPGSFDLPGAWTLHGGLRYTLLRNERVRDADYRAGSLLLGGGRDATSSWWFDASGEVGRRDYRRSGAGGSLVFEGYDISVTGTDYTFVSFSLLGQLAMPRRLRVDLFGLVDRELHAKEEDDFSLWALTVSLTRGF